MHRPSIVAIPIALVVLLASGCGGWLTAAPASPTTATPSVAPTAPREVDLTAASDVKIVKCERTALTQNVDLEVTNSTDEVSTYIVGVVIKDSHGDRSKANFVNHLDPGKTVTQHIPGDTPLKGEISCTVDEAKRLPKP